MIWAALAVFLVSSCVGLVVATRNGLRLFREVRRVRRHGGAALDELTAATERLAQSANKSGARSERLERSVEQLERSLARLRILREAMAETDESTPGWSRART